MPADLRRFIDHPSHFGDDRVFFVIQFAAEHFEVAPLDGEVYGLAPPCLAVMVARALRRISGEAKGTEAGERMEL